MDLEYREFRAAPVSADEGTHMSGVLAPFNSVTTIGDPKRGGWREEIAPGTFTKALKEGDTLLLCDHDMSKPLARMSAGTLSLRETARGLEFDADTAPTSYERDLRINIRAGNKGGCSIGFRPIKEDWYDDDGKPSNRHVGTHRILREVALPEGSIVTNPAYKDTPVMARDALLAEREARADLNAGLSNLEQRELDVILDMLFEDRASSINTAGRKALAAKGHALPDGSYPIPDKSHLHAAAVLAASKHGDYKAAKALIRKRAKALGVDVTTLPGFGGKGKKASRSADAADAERRLKKGVAKRVVILDAELKQISELLAKGDAQSLKDAQALVASSAEHVGHVMHKENLGAKDARSEQKPDASTSADDDTDFALRIAETELDIRSRELGLA